MLTYSTHCKASIEEENDNKRAQVIGNEDNFCDKSFKLNTLVNTQVLICNTFEWSVGYDLKWY